MGRSDGGGRLRGRQAGGRREGEGVTDQSEYGGDARHEHARGA